MADTSTSAWRFFPIATIAALGVTVAVNVFMAYEAVHSFPGTATDASFDTSNRYDAVLAEQAREKALGWTLAVEADGRRPVLLLRGGDGAPLEGARVVAMADRPAGGLAGQRIDLRATTPGRYVAAADLPGQGQWELQLLVARNGQTMRATRRILVP